MSEYQFGLIVFIVINVGSAVICNLYTYRLFIASLMSAIIGNFVFHVIAYVHQGFLDPFFIIAFVIGFVFSFIISLLIGCCFSVLRKKLNN